MTRNIIKRFAEVGIGVVAGFMLGYSLGSPTYTATRGEMVLTDSTYKINLLDDNGNNLGSFEIPREDLEIQIIIPYDPQFQNPDQRNTGKNLEDNII